LHSDLAHLAAQRLRHEACDLPQRNWLLCESSNPQRSALWRRGVALQQPGEQQLLLRVARGVDRLQELAVSVSA